MDLADGITLRVSQIPSQAQEPIWLSRNAFCHKPFARLCGISVLESGSMSAHSLAVIKQKDIFWQSMFILRTSSALKLSSPHLSLCLV